MKSFFKKCRNFFATNLVITVKWTLLTSMFIFLLFSIFAFVTYKTSTDLLVREEKTNLKNTSNEITQRLEQSDHSLSMKTTAFYLKGDKENLPGSPNNKTIEANLIQLNSFISELAQPELNVTVYNKSKKLIFETQSENWDYRGSEKSEMKESQIGKQTGFLATQPVYSNKTKELIGYTQLFYDLSSVQTIKTKLLSTMILLIAGGTLISLTLGFILSSYFLKPLKKMTQIINVIKTDPQSNVRLPELQSKDEFSDLTEVFNDMLDRMQKFIEQQQQFVEDVSHELRTPVAIIEGHLKLLNRWGKDDPEVLEESLEASLQEIIRMKSLVQEMLDLSRLEQVEFQHKNDISLAKEVTHQTFNNFEILYPDFTFILDDDLYKERKVKIYRHHFEQLLIIILDNAVKYSRERKEIHMSVSSTRSDLEIAIQDFGEGIDEEDITQIFNRFYRVDKARSRHKGGNGLGLSIAKELVESYGGHILAESALGVGTIFRIFLPMVEEEKVVEDKKENKKS
ncbi:HAMP domain-containing sensor histidine kinase [Vagococcus intermedius]|uniref:Signal transduction histidine-protein kinase ArlS n=1 Tax=Vagococcus intermedius TaxID=2991418 RepID=A0AAF0I6I0_9ENTE|nr:HAMP domain-containing histidine kinase [Vagococcus intermedius]WEG72690.1 HAMP domain-containing histidine kinase [Vagococcus intermedius]WEG74775.1 HAMP domain-containing histidine kinase [Vagococcus intermedius]